MRASLAAALVASIAGAACLASCKDKPSTATPPASAESIPTPPTPLTPPAAKPRVEPPRPALPTPAAASTGAAITVEEAEKMYPAIDSKQILGAKPTSDGKQVHETWCMDGTGADDVARKVGEKMAAAGYTGLAIRGDAKKAGVQGDREGYRMSMVVSASSAANCPAPQHYFASATIFKP
jgi:hypothetical protein